MRGPPGLYRVGRCRSPVHFRPPGTGVPSGLPYTSGVGLDWLLALCAWLPLPVLAVAARRVQGQWLAPGAMVALTWTLAAGVPLWLAPDLPVHAGAYGFVLVVVVVCVLA